MSLTEKQARYRVHQLRSFYNQVTSYLLVNAMLIAINLVTSPDSLWFYWVTIFWGFGLLISALNVYRSSPEGRFGQAWEDRKMAELTKKK